MTDHETHRRAEMVMDLGIKLAQDLHHVIAQNFVKMERVGMPPKDQVIAMIVGVEALRQYIRTRDDSGNVTKLYDDCAEMIVEATQRMDARRKAERG